MQALGEAFDRDSSGVSEVDCVFVSISTAPLDTRWRHVRRGLGESLPPPPLPGPLSPSPPVAGPRRNRPGAWHLMCARMLSPTLQRTPMLIHGSAHRCYRHHARAVLVWAGCRLPVDGSGQGIRSVFASRNATTVLPWVHTGAQEGQHEERRGATWARWPSRLLLRARCETRPRDQSDERGGDGRARGRP